MKEVAKAIILLVIWVIAFAVALTIFCIVALVFVASAVATMIVAVGRWARRDLSQEWRRLTRS